jgi:hypothetical protein
MPTLRNRLLAVALLTAASLALTGRASAQQPSGLITKGVYNGLWHGDKVKFIVEKVSRDGKFSGIIHFDPKGRWGDVKTEFTGKIGVRDSIVIKRPDSEQEARAGAPKHEGKFWLWKGKTTGKGLEDDPPFEIRIPR